MLEWMGWIDGSLLGVADSVGSRLGLALALGAPDGLGCVDGLALAMLG
jgi:hypothetical protein